MAITQIPSEFFAANTISGTIIADNAITAVHIATNAVSGTLIADNAVTAVHIATNAISGTLIADNAVTAVHIAGTSVTATQIQDNAIGTGQLAGIARGKIIYGDSSGDPQLLTLGSNGQVLKSDGTDISWGSISQPITALNNATENELITVGATTTELNAESGLTWDTNTLAVTGAVTVSGAITGNLTGNASGTALTVTNAEQWSITSLGTLNTLTVDNVIINGTTIGHTSDTDLLTFASGVLTVAGEVSMTTLDIGGTNITSTAAELNYVDGVTSAIQTQIDTKASTGKAIAMSMVFG